MNYCIPGLGLIQEESWSRQGPGLFLVQTGVYWSLLSPDSRLMSRGLFSLGPGPGLQVSGSRSRPGSTDLGVPVQVQTRVYRSQCPGPGLGLQVPVSGLQQKSLQLQSGPDRDLGLMDPQTQINQNQVWVFTMSQILDNLGL